jgi:hypothetical protein
LFFKFKLAQYLNRGSFQYGDPPPLQSTPRQRSGNNSPVYPSLPNNGVFSLHSQPTWPQQLSALALPCRRILYLFTFLFSYELAESSTLLRSCILSYQVLCFRALIFCSPFPLRFRKLFFLDNQHVS